MTDPLLDPELITAAEFDRVGADAQRLLATKNDTIIFPGEAIVPLEGIARSLGSPGITALNIVTSPYGRYFGRWLADSGATVVEIVAPDGEAVSVDAVAKALESNPDISVVAFVHAEAIGGVVNDAASISRLARDHGAVVALDAVASFGANEVLIDEWGIDVVVVGPQKALAGPSGVSLVAVSDRAWEWFSENSVAPRHSSLSLLDWKVSWLDTERVVVPVILAPLEIHALDAALSRVREEGLDAVESRHQASAAAARAGGRALGLEPLARDEEAAAIATTLLVSDGRDAREVVSTAQVNGPVALTAGFGDLATRVVRVDHTGQRAQLGVVLDALDALGTALGEADRLASARSAAEAAWRNAMGES
jgi:aspartate aminotransferase-like enzyme